MGSLAVNIWQAPISQALNEHCIPRLSVGTTVQISTLGYDAEIIGAAALVMDNFEKELPVKKQKKEKASKNNLEV
jgi:hypothetical protein